MIMDMKKISLILFFICISFAFQGLAEEIEIDSEVIGIDREDEFFIIRAGEDAGVEIGDGLVVHRDGDKIATAYIIEVAPNVSAAEMLEAESGKEIQEGDSILIVKKVESPEKAPEKIKGPKSKWTPILGKGSESGSTEGPYDEFIKQFPKDLRKGDVASISIYRDPETVFSYARLILRENGYSITSSNRATGILEATKPIELSLMSELWADAFAAIDHKLVMTLEIKNEGDSSSLTVSSFKEHSQKNKHIRHAVVQHSRYYNELIDLVSKIKERSEY